MTTLETFTDKVSFGQGYDNKISLEHRKKYGQFFTPEPVADLMARWVTAVKPQCVLDPAVGTGILARAIRTHLPNVKIVGLDIDPIILSWTLKENDGQSISLIQTDFLRYDWEARFDGIIANPPYLKFHNYDNKAAITQVQPHIDVKLSGFTNLYALFLIKAIHQLNEGGRAAFLVPSEFLNADYGVAIKEYLLRQRCIRHILIVHFEQMLFSDALTTACVLLLEKNSNSTNVFFADIQSTEELSSWSPNSLKAMQWPHKELDATVKWRSYYQVRNKAAYKHLIPFHSVGKVVRGIATGANDYFMFSTSKAKLWGITNRNLIPCVAKSADITTTFFNENSFKHLQQMDKHIYLFNAIPQQDEAVKKYIAKGVQEGVHTKFLTANRRPWYSLENRPPAPIWVTVFNRNGLRFIRNETQTCNLTTFHCVYLSMFYQHKTDLVMAYLLTDVSKEIFNDNRREYGNGLQKFEPNDLNKAMMLDLEKLNHSVEEKILRLYHQYRQSEVDDQTDESLRLQIDELFRDFYSH